MPQAAVGAPSLRGLWHSGVMDRGAGSPRRWESGRHQGRDAARLGVKQRGQGGQEDREPAFRRGRISCRKSPKSPAAARSWPSSGLTRCISQLLRET